MKAPTTPENSADDGDNKGNMDNELPPRPGKWSKMVPQEEDTDQDPFFVFRSVRARKRSVDTTPTKQSKTGGDQEPFMGSHVRKMRAREEQAERERDEFLSRPRTPPRPPSPISKEEETQRALDIMYQQMEDESANRRKTRNEPVWPLPPGEEGKEPKPLYDNLLDRENEKWVSSQLTKISRWIRIGDFQNAEDELFYVFRSAKNLNYVPLLARCWYWQGMLRRAQGRQREAAIAFVKAKPCISRYEEGEDLLMQLNAYFSEICEIYGPQAAAWTRDAVPGASASPPNEIYGDEPEVDLMVNASPSSAPDEKYRTRRRRMPWNKDHLIDLMSEKTASELLGLELPCMEQGSPVSSCWHTPRSEMPSVGQDWD